jgi:hypothetical protein
MRGCSFGWRIKFGRWTFKKTTQISIFFFDLSLCLGCDVGMSTPGKTIECLFGNQKEACWSRHLAMPATFVYISQTCIFFVGMGTKIERSGGRPCFCVRMMQTIFFKQRERSHRNCFRKFSIWKLFCANSNVMGVPPVIIHFVYSGFPWNLPTFGVPCCLPNHLCHGIETGTPMSLSSWRIAVESDWRVLEAAPKELRSEREALGVPQSSPWVSILSHGCFWLGWLGVPIF